MPASRGSNGAVLIGSDQMAFVTQWSLGSAQEVADTTSLGDTDRTHIPVLRATTGSFQGHFDISDTAQAAMYSQIVSSSDLLTVTLVLIYNNTAGSVAGYTGTATLTNIEITDQVDNTVQFSADYEYSGGVTAYTT